MLGLVFKYNVQFVQLKKYNLMLKSVGKNIVLKVIYISVCIYFLSKLYLLKPLLNLLPFKAAIIFNKIYNK